MYCKLHFVLRPAPGMFDVSQLELVGCGGFSELGIGVCDSPTSEFDRALATANRTMVHAHDDPRALVPSLRSVALFCYQTLSFLPLSISYCISLLFFFGFSHSLPLQPSVYLSNTPCTYCTYTPPPLGPVSVINDPQLDPSELHSFFTISSKASFLFPFAGLFSHDVIFFGGMNLNMYRPNYEQLLTEHEYDTVAVFTGVCVPISGCRSLYCLHDSAVQ